TALLAIVAWHLQHEVTPRLVHPIKHHDVGAAFDPLKAGRPARVDVDGADRLGFARILGTILALLPRRPDPPNEIERRVGGLRQSQPRISRHLKLLADAGLVERFREGSWAFFRLGELGGRFALARDLVGRLDPTDAVLARDRERLAEVREAHAAAAQSYFRKH